MPRILTLLAALSLVAACAGTDTERAAAGALTGATAALILDTNVATGAAVGAAAGALCDDANLCEDQ